jgi:hypothetical protein
MWEHPLFSRWGPVEGSPGPLEGTPGYGPYGVALEGDPWSGRSRGCPMEVYPGGSLNEAHGGGPTQCGPLVESPGGVVGIGQRDRVP